MIRRPVGLVTLSIQLACLLSVTVLAQKPNSLDVDDKAINFELPTVGEKSYVELREEFKQGPVVVVVLRGYPGYQCMMCSQQYGSLVNRAKALAKEAHRVIVVYPGEPSELERHAKRFMGSRAVPEPLVLVRDAGMEMVSDWGLRWEKHHETAYPATFVVDTNGRIAWKKVSSSHGDRSSVEEILRALRKL